MAHILLTEPTPNPLAYKLRLDQAVTIGGGKQYNKKEDARDNPIAQKFFDIHGVESVYFSDDFITINKTPGGIWDFIVFQADEILSKIEKITPIQRGGATTGKDLGEKDFAKLAHAEKIAYIDSIINETIRPALARDGGDLQILGLEENTLRVRYQGACGSCPSATGATLNYIANMLQNRVSPDLQVIPG